MRRAGCAVWPFDEPRLPLVLEIYPRLLTGPVAKSNPVARRDYLAAMDLSGLPRLSAESREKAEESEDAFDALVSALALYRRRAGFARLKAASDAAGRLEGAVC